MPKRKKNELRDSLVGLTEACPFHQDNPEDCPLFQLRKMEPVKRLEWFDALTGDDLAYLATYHHVCFATKVAAQAISQARPTTL
jgi:hypothetical protein